MYSALNFQGTTWDFTDYYPIDFPESTSLGLSLKRGNMLPIEVVVLGFCFPWWKKRHIVYCLILIVERAIDEMRWRMALEKMTESCIRTAVEALHSSPYQAVLYLAGGASQVLSLSLSLSLYIYIYMMHNDEAVCSRNWSRWYWTWSGCGLAAISSRCFKYCAWSCGSLL